MTTARARRRIARARKPGKFGAEPAGRPRFRVAFLGPKFWPTWARLLGLRLTLLLPRPWVMAAGGCLGDFLRRRNAKRRRIAEVNLRLCFPALTKAEREALLREHFRQYGRGVLDMALVLWGSRARVDRWCALPRREELRRWMRRGPVIVVAYHQTTLDLGGGIVARAHPCVSMMKRDRNPLVTWQLWRGREHLDRANIRVLMRDQGLRPLLRELRAGRLCFFIPDEDFGLSRHSVLAPFFGQPRATLTVVGRLARLTGATVLPSATVLDAQSGRYEMILGDALQDFPGDDAAADAAKLNLAMEALIRRAPASYMWTFRWFKTRADGAPNPYKTPGGDGDGDGDVGDGDDVGGDGALSRHPRSPLSRHPRSLLSGGGHGDVGDGGIDGDGDHHRHSDSGDDGDGESPGGAKPWTS